MVLSFVAYIKNQAWTNHTIHVIRHCWWCWLFSPVGDSVMDSWPLAFLDPSSVHGNDLHLWSGWRGACPAARSLMLGADWLAGVIIRGILNHNLSAYCTPYFTCDNLGPCCGFLSVGMALWPHVHSLQTLVFLIFVFLFYRDQIFLILFLSFPQFFFQNLQYFCVEFCAWVTPCPQIIEFSVEIELLHVIHNLSILWFFSLSFCFFPWFSSSVSLGSCFIWCWWVSILFSPCEFVAKVTAAKIIKV